MTELRFILATQCNCFGQRLSGDSYRSKLASSRSCNQVACCLLLIHVLPLLLQRNGVFLLEKMVEKQRAHNIKWFQYFPEETRLSIELSCVHQV
jgi:hypothetical protein